MPSLSDSALATAAARALETGTGLAEPDVLAVLQLPDEEVPAALELAHQVRMRWCGPEIEVEGIVSVKTGGCTEDCHFCSLFGMVSSPFSAVCVDIRAIVEAALQTVGRRAAELPEPAAGYAARRGGARRCAGCAAGDRGVPAGVAAHDPAVRRGAGDHARRPGYPGRAARRDQRGDRRELPDHAGSLGGPGS